MYDIPKLLFADDKGVIYDHPTLKMTVRSENLETVPYELEMEAVPHKTKLNFLESTLPLAYNPEKAGMEVFKSGHAVYIEPPEGYLRLYLPAYKKRKEIIFEDKEYTPIGWMNESFVSPIINVDKIPDKNSEATGNKFHGFLKSIKKKNAFVKYLLGNSDLYHTKNEEIRLPVDKDSMQADSREFTEILSHYSEIADKPVLNIDYDDFSISNGETEATQLLKGIEYLKKNYDKLSITFSSYLQNIETLKMFTDAGVDCINVKMISTNTETNKIFNKENDTDNVYKSLQALHKQNILKSLTLYTMPGLTDRESETESLRDFLSTFDINLLLLRNLRADPDRIFFSENLKTEDIKGLKNVIKLIKKKMKNLRIGYFNRHKEQFLIEYGMPDFKRRK